MSKTLKTTLLRGTIILTMAGALTKLLGFYNRIFLSQTIGAREIGIYQLIFPVYLIIHCVCCMGFEMGITKFVAEEMAFGNRKNILRYLKISFSLSFLLSICFMVLLLAANQPIAVFFLQQADCSKCLYIMAFALPFISIKDTILSYFYAVKDTIVPAASQLLEQCFRVGTIWFLGSVLVWVTQDATIAAWGLVAGEIASCILAVMCFPKMMKTIYQCQNPKECILPNRTIFKRLMVYCIPLTVNRLLITFLNSVEAILIPYYLTKLYGNENTALEIYGVLTGMALTFVLFPSAITNSLAMVLLPTISEANAQKQNRIITRTATLCLHYCLLLGILCTTIFLMFGKELGIEIFHNQLAGEFLVMLSWLCPFIYITTTFTSILNGLGKTNLTFENNIISVMIRILAIVVGIPWLGLQGYLIGLLISYALSALLSIWHVKKYASFYFNAKKSILTPVCLTIFGAVFAYICDFMLLHAGMPSELMAIGISIVVLCFLYCGGSYLLHLDNV